MQYGGHEHFSYNATFIQASRMSSRMRSISDLAPRIIEEWLKRPAGERTERDVLLFRWNFNAPSRTFSRFKSRSPDKYIDLKSILRKHIEF